MARGVLTIGPPPLLPACSHYTLAPAAHYDHDDDDDYDDYDDYDVYDNVHLRSGGGLFEAFVLLHLSLCGHTNTWLFLDIFVGTSCN